jgi:tRNA modification GTPase
LLLAETEAQRRVAVRAAEGGVRREVAGWTERLLLLAAQVEAQLDHSDEDDVAGGADSLAGIRKATAELAGDIGRITVRPPVERLRDGLRVVLAGPPNAGKSTLLNAMARREAAIVSAIAGTTRDRIEAPVVRDGVAWLLIDTAGLAERTADPIEAIGIDRARAALEEADVLLWLGDDAPPPHPVTLWLHARADLPGRNGPAGQDLAVSAATGAGLEALWARLGALAAALLPPLDQLALNRRQREFAQIAGEALDRAALQQDSLLLAEELRTARRAFDAITGKADVEAMLDALFARFCIGK